MRRWFALPQLDDEYETFAARVLHYALLVLLAIVFIFLPFATSTVQLVFIPSLLAVLGACYYLLHTGRFRVASMGFISGLWIIVTIASFNINGILNASMTAYAIVIIFAAIFFTDRMVVIFTALSVFSAVILMVGDSAGILPLNTTPLFKADRFFQLVALFSVAGILLSAASRVIRSSFQRIRAHEIMLLERNQALEAEIAERQRVEADLRVSEEKYRLLFENISAMAAVYDKNGQILLLNDAAAKIFSRTVEALRGRNLREVLTSEDAESAIEHQRQVMQEGKSSLSESSTTLPNGHTIHYLRHVIPIPNSQTDEISQVLVITTDLTERHRARQRERELALAQEKNAFLTEFFSTLSHDLKTPLTVLKTSVYLLQRASTEEQRQSKMARIDEQISLMDKYIQDMLTISRLEHLPSMSYEAIDLNRMIDRVVDVLRPKIEDQQLHLHLIQEANLASVQGDEEQLHRLLMNLIENAVNYTPRGGKVSIRTEMRNERIGLDVMDSGIGIEPEAVPFIFDRFFRTNNAQSFNHNGTGLGLAIVKKIVDMHHATVDVKSEPGEGTTFSVQFPSELTAG